MLFAIWFKFIIITKKTPTKRSVIVTALTDANVIQPFLPKLLKVSRTCLLIVLAFISVITSLFVTDNLTSLNRNHSVLNRIHDFFIVSSHQHRCPSFVDFIQNPIISQEVSGSRFPVGSSAITTFGELTIDLCNRNTLLFST